MITTIIVLLVLCHFEDLWMLIHLLNFFHKYCSDTYEVTKYYITILRFYSSLIFQEQKYIVLLSKRIHTLLYDKQSNNYFLVKAIRLANDKGSYHIILVQNSPCV